MSKTKRPAMKYPLTLTCFIFSFVLRCFGQDTIRSNPILYLDAGVGGAFGNISGFSYNSSFNWQHKQNLITVRVAGVQGLEARYAELSPFTIIPLFRNAGTLFELSVMDGRRIVSGGHSFSLSAGISFNNESIPYYYPNSNRLARNAVYNYPGLPFEANILWFKSRRKRYHIYEIIPVGKPTAFGHSYGLKISGNISAHSYLAFGMVMGWGFHKDYSAGM